MPDRTIPQRLRGRAFGAIWRATNDRIKDRGEFNGYALGGIAKKGILYARADPIMRVLFQIEDKGNGSSFVFKPMPGLRTFGISEEVAQDIVDFEEYDNEA